VDVMPPLEITAAVPRGPAQAGEWLPLAVTLRLPQEHPTAVRVRTVGCQAAGVLLNLDLFPQDVLVRPGEAFRATIPVQVGRPGLLRLRDFFVELRDGPEVLPFPDLTLPVGPSLVREINVRLEPLCTYDEGTRIELTLEHQGATTFRDVNVNLGPEQALYAGKSPLKLGTFEPGMCERVELVVRGEELDINLAADAGGERTSVLLRQPVGRTAPLRDRARFRFLEPRRLAIDPVRVRRGPERSPVAMTRTAYPLYAGETYYLEIRPRDPHVTDVRLNNIDERVYVRNKEVEAGRCWTFELDVPYDGFFSKPDRLVYEADSPEGALSGEIPLMLVPPLRKHGLFALTLGITLTVQGVLTLFRFLVDHDFSPLSLGQAFQLTHDYPVLYPLTIPALLLGVKLWDWLQYRWQT
jgi:hypothetical protein